MPAPSTQNLSALPDITGLKKLCQSLAMLDAVIYPDWQGRYYSFDDCWDTDVSLASMRDGSGDHFFILFTSVGVVIKGFAHESAMSPYRANPPSAWPGIYESVPEGLKTALSDPALSMEDVTFCIWHSTGDSYWIRGDIAFPHTSDPDGSADLLALLDGNPKSYQGWAEEYYEREIDLSAVEHICDHKPLTNSIIRLLNCDIALDNLAADVKEIGYSTKQKATL